jgi:hypothetical protein
VLHSSCVGGILTAIIIISNFPAVIILEGNTTDGRTYLKETYTTDKNVTGSNIKMSKVLAACANCLTPVT